jgi:hypothetical protein
MALAGMKLAPRMRGWAAHHALPLSALQVDAAGMWAVAETAGVTVDNVIVMV